MNRESHEARINAARRGSPTGMQDQQVQRAVAQYLDRYLNQTLRDFATVKERLEILFGIRGKKEDRAVREKDLPAIPKDLSTPWVTLENDDLANGWESNGAAYGNRYRRNSAGMVQIEGVLTGGEVGPSSYGFILPKGMRPGSRLIFTTQSNGNTPTRLDITESGEVVMYAGNTEWFSITVSFMADQ